MLIFVLLDNFAVNSVCFQGGEVKATKGKDKFKCLIVVLFSIFAAFLAKLSMSLYGPGLSYDSTEYIRLARDISANGFASGSKRLLI